MEAIQSCAELIRNYRHSLTQERRSGRRTRNCREHEGEDGAALCASDRDRQRAAAHSCQLRRYCQPYSQIGLTDERDAFIHGFQPHRNRNAGALTPRGHGDRPRWSGEDDGLHEQLAESLLQAKAITLHASESLSRLAHEGQLLPARWRGCIRERRSK